MRKDLNIELYRKMCLIRTAEQGIRDKYPEDGMKTPMHMSMGEEAIAVGVSSALKETDQVFGTYRSHAIYLAKTDDSDDFFAELYGRSTALLRGRGGSMHLCAPKHGFMGSSAIVASNISAAVGSAFANKCLNNKKIVAVFFGDGAVDEGCFWESLNFASLMKIPILFVYEDNGYAVHSPVSQRHGYNSITKIIEGFNCSVRSIDTTDVEEIYNLASKCLEELRNDSGPVFLHLKYYRYCEHVGIAEDFNAGYRLRAEFEEWKKRDPLLLQRNKLINLGFSEDEIIKIEKEVNVRIEGSIKRAQNAPFPDKNELYKELY
ncbi:MAG: thiamine pyrophosphate-dependent dehydrogenase E1 component subunit alpha [Candidatus Omnitrophica bacterium]|nr:thiamine pyrophosphate-dependent dehydrogenase E1 component subunit alpha [Candidatus Omnitrophota bacterium]